MTMPDLDLMKQVNRQFVTGVTVVTTMDDQTPRGLAVNAFSSVSLEPPTVMVCVQVELLPHSSVAVQVRRQVFVPAQPRSHMSP